MELRAAAPLHAPMGLLPLGRQARTQGRHSRVQQPRQPLPDNRRPERSIHRPLPGSAGRHAIGRLPFRRNPLGEERPRPEIPLHVSPAKGKTTGFAACNPFYPLQPPAGARHGEKRAQFQQIRILPAGASLRQRQLDTAAHPADSAQALKPLIIPGKGKAVRVYPWNMALLRNTLVLHEKKRAEIKNDTLYIEGQPAQYCCFTKDYYWVGADNPTNLSDSRLFGLVPKDHIIGKAAVIWFSKEQGTGLFSGYRRERMWKKVR